MVYYYADGNLVGKFYVKSIQRTSKCDYKIIAQSYAGILDTMIHVGGVYNGESFPTVAAAIMGGQSATYSSDVQAVKVYGWLPYDTARANLHQLLFASGVNLTKTSTGELYFAFLDNSSAKAVADSRIYLDGTVDYTTPASGCEVTEHTYLEDTTGGEYETLYDNTSTAVSADNQLVTWDHPVSAFKTTGSIVINSSGYNHAYISGVGTLTGLPMLHTTSIISRGSSTNAARVESATLVNALNSENVADRMNTYYGSSREIRVGIIPAGERPGDYVQMKDPYSEALNGFIESMEVVGSGITKAVCGVISDYVPTASGNNYTRAAVLTGSGTWTVPSGVTRIRVACIQGGTGGTGGSRGGDGETLTLGYDSDDTRTYEMNSSANVGSGGAAGSRGAGGAVAVFNVSVSSGQSFAYSCGSGGAGGAGELTNVVDETVETDTEGVTYTYHKSYTTTAAKAGSAGGHSTFGSYSSSSGSSMSSQGGYINLVTGAIYGTYGSNGSAGGAGFRGATSLTGYGSGSAGGAPSEGTCHYYYGGSRHTQHWTSGGGGQGGSASGVAGEAGETKPDLGGYYNTRTDMPSCCEDGSRGGMGAAAPTPAKASVYGQGGQGGNGGGGGGTGGRYYWQITSSMSGSCYLPGGFGGSGGTGGQGGDGCVIVYY